MSIDLIKDIKTWFEKAKPNPTEKDVSVQLGVHFEEVAEMLSSIAMQSDDTKAKVLHKLSIDDAISTSLNFKNHLYPFTIDRQEMLDALCDQIVTAVGVAHMLGMDIENALIEVNRSNWSKFENGEPIINKFGKIAKGKDYTPPDLKDFV